MFPAPLVRAGAIGMHDDRRKHQRIRTLKAGKITFNRRLNVIDCIVRNMSEGGACIQIDSPDWLPEKFDLSIPIDGWNSTSQMRADTATEVATVEEKIVRKIVMPLMRWWARTASASPRTSPKAPSRTAGLTR